MHGCLLASGLFTLYSLYFPQIHGLSLREESVLNSPLELSALVRSFVECIQYSVRWCAENEDSPSSEIRSLIVDQVACLDLCVWQRTAVFSMKKPRCPCFTN
ncbi:hypothetical protein BsWGS_28476 [Bradybaena similaris]